MWPELLRRDRLALLAAFVTPLAVTAVLVPFRTSLANTDAALVLVAVVVAVAALGYRLPGYVAAASSATWFDFFLTRPYEQFNITRSSDVETTALLLIIGVAVTEMSVWGHRQNASASRRAGYLQGIYAAAEATGGHGAPTAVIARITEQITTLLGLRDCHYQSGVAGLGVSARLQHDGRVTVDDQDWDVDAEGMPPREVEIVVQSGGRLCGRFRMRPGDDAHPTMEQRLVAIALADQVGAMMSSQDLPVR